MGKCNCSNSISKYIDVSKLDLHEWEDAGALLAMNECGNVILVDKYPYELTEEDREKLDNLIINGEGNLYLSDDGVYKKVTAFATVSQRLVYYDDPVNFVIQNNGVIRDVLEILEKGNNPQVRMDISGSEVPVQVIKENDRLLFQFEGSLIHIPGATVEPAAELHRFLAFVYLDVSTDPPTIIEYKFGVREVVEYLPLAGGTMTGDLSFSNPSGVSKVNFYDKAAGIEADTSGNLLLKGESITLENADSSFIVEDDGILIRTNEVTIETDNLRVYNTETLDINTSLLNYNGQEVATVKDIEESQTGFESQIDLVSEALQTEIERATTAEEELTKSLEGETIRAKEVEEELQRQINTEVERAIIAEDQLTKSLEDEIIRAKEVEEDLQGQIDEEMERAISVEGELQTRIDDHLAGYESFTTTVDESFQTVNTELGNLQTQITENREDLTINAAEIEALRDDFNNQEHFRGVYTASIDIVTGVSTPEHGDYAYSLESNTVWTYDGSNWSDSGSAIPSGVYSFSDNTPLMDMEGGSAGTANTISRSDHKHPSDITKANVTDLDGYLSLSGNSSTTPMRGDIWLGSTNQLHLSDSGTSYLGLEADEATLELRGNGTGGVDITSDLGSIKANGRRIIVDGENGSPTVIQADESKLTLSTGRASLSGERLRLRGKESASLKTTNGDIVLDPEAGRLYYGTPSEPGNEVAKVSDVDDREETLMREMEENYLPLSGGTLSDSLTLSSGNVTVQGDQSVRFNGNGSTRISYNTLDDELEIIASTTNYGVDVVTNPSVITSTFKYNGVEVATVTEFDDYYTRTETEQLLDKKQNLLMAGDNISITGNTISADKSVDIAASDEMLTYGVAGLKANLSVKVEGNTIRLLGKDGIVVGEFTVLQSQIIEHVEVADGYLNITFIVKDGTEKVKIDLSEFIDVYEGSEYIDVKGKTVSLDYKLLKDELVNDGIALGDFVDLTSDQTIGGGKRFTNQVTTDSSLATGQKRSSTDGLTGGLADHTGNMHLQGRNPSLNFYNATATSPTSSIKETERSKLKIDSPNGVDVVGPLKGSASISTGGKTSADTGMGIYLGADGTMHMNHTSGSSINFHYENSETVTSRLKEIASGIINVSGGLQWNGILIPINSDLNDYRTPGFYYCTTALNAQSIANVPQGLAFGMLVLKDAYCRQIFFCYNPATEIYGKIYTRNEHSSGWTAWSEILTDKSEIRVDKLNDSVNLWGQSFDGSSDINGDITSSGNISASGIISSSEGLEGDLHTGLITNKDSDTDLQITSSSDRKIVVTPQEGQNLEVNTSGEGKFLYNDKEVSTQVFVEGDNIEFVHNQNGTITIHSPEFDTVLVVSELPKEGEGNRLYLLITEGSTNKDYKSYLWIDTDEDGNSEWVLLSSLSGSMDLTDYYTKGEVDKLISQNSSEIYKIDLFELAIGGANIPKIIQKINNEIQIIATFAEEDQAAYIPLTIIYEDNKINFSAVTNDEFYICSYIYENEEWSIKDNKGLGFLPAEKYWQTSSGNNDEEAVLLGYSLKNAREIYNASLSEPVLSTPTINDISRLIFYDQSYGYMGYKNSATEGAMNLYFRNGIELNTNADNPVTVNGNKILDVSGNTITTPITGELYKTIENDNVQKIGVAPSTKVADLRDSGSVTLSFGHFYFTLRRNGEDIDVRLGYLIPSISTPLNYLITIYTKDGINSEQYERNLSNGVVTLGTYNSAVIKVEFDLYITNILYKFTYINLKSDFSRCVMSCEKLL